MVNKKRLTGQQQRFIELLLSDPMRNATKAYRGAYPKCKTDKVAGVNATKLLGKARIQAAIAEAEQERMERVHITQDWVLFRLKENVERSMQREAVLDREGNHTGEYVYQGSVANRALELLGKHIGMFADKHNIEVTGFDWDALFNALNSDSSK